MKTMLDVLGSLGHVSLKSFWIPLLVWTMVTLPVFLILKHHRDAHPSILYAIHQSLLMALPLTFLLIPILGVLPSPAIQTALGSVMSAEQHLSGRPWPVVADSLPFSRPLDLLHLLGALSLGVMALAASRSAAIVRRTTQLNELRGALQPVTDPIILDTFERLASSLAIQKAVGLFEGPARTIPFTFGHKRPAIVVPKALLSDPDALSVVLEHELMHVARADYLFGFFEQAVAALFAAHPLTACLRDRIAELREQCCDLAVLERKQVTASRYAQLVLQFGVGSARPEIAGVPMMTHPASNLKTRINAMKRQNEPSSSRRISRRRWTAGVLTLVVPAIMAACSAGGGTGQPADTGSTISGFDMQNAEVDMARLEVQMEYLTEELEMLRPRMEAALLSGEDLDMMPDYRRFRLLQELHMQRLGVYETLKLEQETDRRLGMVAAP